MPLHLSTLDKGVANGVASLDGSGKIPVSQVKSPTNTVIVNSASDLPTPSGGKITLAASTKYIFGGASINIGTDYLEVLNDCAIEGVTGIVSQLIYTGTGGAIRVTDANFTLSHITVVASAGQVFTCSNAVLSKILVVQNTIFASCASIGSITGFELVNFNFNKFQSCTTGLTVNGVNSCILLDNYFDSTNTGTFLLFSGGTFDNIIVSRNYIDVPLGSVGIDMPTATITITEFASYTSNILEGAGTIYQNFTHTDARVDVKANIGIPDTVAMGTMYWTANTTAMATYGLNTWGKITGGTSLALNLARFTHVSPNKLTYAGIGTKDFHVSVDLAAYYNTGGAFKAEIGIAVNGSVVTGSSNAFSIYGNPGDEPCSTNVDLTLSTNDYVEIFINDRTGAAGNYVITYFNVQINEL